jgi:hypothetical protein
MLTRVEPARGPRARNGIAYRIFDHRQIEFLRRGSREVAEALEKNLD